MSFPFGEELTLHGRTRTGEDAYGNDVYSDAPTTLEGVAVWPRPASEVDDSTIVGLSALLPAGTDVEGIDYITRSGVDYEIDGEPADYRSPLTGTRPGVVVNLSRMVGR